MIVLGLTGSIGMGKTTTAAMFRDMGIPVHDADAVVHELYEGPAAALVEAEFPGTTTNGRVDRALLAARVLDDKEALKRLEAIVHPMVRERDKEFRARARAQGARLAIVDVPLLFETGGDKRVDGVIVVTTTGAEQRRRVLARDGMSEEKFRAILASQLPDAQKRERADFIVDTTDGLEAARQQVADIVEAVFSGSWRPG